MKVEVWKYIQHIFNIAINRDGMSGLCVFSTIPFYPGIWLN